MEKGDQDHLNYHQPPGISTDWRFGSHQPPPPQLGVMPSNPMSAGSSPPCPSVSMVDSYCPSLWDHPPPNSQGMGFPDSTNAPIRPPALDSSRLEMGAAGMYLPHGGGILPPTGGLPQFAADSGFIERAARFSCLGSTSFSALMSPYGLSQPLDGYSTGLKMMLGGQNPHHDGPSMGESSKDVLGMGVDHGSPNGGSPMSSQRDGGALSAAVAGDDSGEGELNVIGEDPNMENGTADPSSKGLAAKKRKRNGQELVTEQPNGEAETSNEKAEGKKCAEDGDSTLAAIKSDGNNNGRNASDPPKEEYVHVRARRGQATNSHSLAERVRREKISERMKFLQDLVPGCSKVTGKAVMLDEIINYVQSLQRQVELLSMKLAAVNPHLDYNLEGMLTKDILQQRPGPSGLAFPPEVPHALLHQSQGFILPGMPGMGTDALRRAIGAPMTTMNTYKEAKQQIPNAWENEFQNVFQMGYGTNPPIDIQDLNGTLPHPTNDS